MQPQQRSIKNIASKSSSQSVRDISTQDAPSSHATNIDSNPPSPSGERIKVPGFVTKLYNMLSDPTLSPLICWSPSGTSFTVTRPEEFARRVLPAYFKHNNFSSFVRQLNMYGFKKVQQAGSPGTASGQGHLWGFAHEEFLRDQPERMILVKRKTTKDEESHIISPSFEPNMGNLEASPGDAYGQALSRLHLELRSLRAHQVSMQGELSSLQVESQRIWHENQLIRNRANQQQEIIDRIIRFLASMFSGTDATRNLVMPDFLNAPNIQNVLHRYQSTGGLSDPLYPTAPTPVVTGQKRPLPLTWDAPTDYPSHNQFQKALGDLNDSFADQAHDLDDLQDQLNKITDISIQKNEEPDDLDIFQYLDEYPVEDEFLIKDHNQ